MHIKTLTIQGFKSYRDQVAIEPFSPGQNVVVGRNGSGKSNFFLAIRFVLYDAYTSMTREERASLLHEGNGKSTTLSAFVEIVFDNSDGRFPTNNPELYLRRTIGMKKDEYSVDRKSASKAEVMNLLESAGFSRSNPYYIVPQGRITLLTNMKENERLDLLKEVAGTQVYEDRRKESLKIMDETAAKKLKIADLLSKIEERLTELEEEKAELKDFQMRDRQRRCLEYAYYQRELDDVEAALEGIEEERRKDIDSGNEKRLEFNEREEEIKKLEADIATARHELTALELTGRQSQEQMNDLIREREEVRCSIDDLQAFEVDGKTKKKTLSVELDQIKKKMKEVQKKLDEITPEVEAKVKEERQMMQSLDASQARLEALYAKQGRTNKFKTKNERDNFLKQEIETTRHLQTSQQERVQDLIADVEAARQRMVELDAQQEEVTAELDQHRKSLSKLTDERVALKTKSGSMTERQKELWREDGKLTSMVSNARQEKQNAERALSGVMDKDTANGLASVKRIAAEHQLDGVFGPLYELFSVDDKYKTAIEVTAGNSLFHVVVDTDETVTKILEHMKGPNAGRLTFMPLNRLKSHDNRLPVANDAIPMIEKLKFNRDYRPAIEQVFGRTIICPDLATAGQYSRSNGCNAITLDGDRVDRKGALTGGFHDVRRSRIDCIRAVKIWTDRYETDSAKHLLVKSEITNLEQQISVTLGQINKIESSLKKARDARQPLLEQLDSLQIEKQRMSDRVARLEAAQAEAERDSRRMAGNLESLKTELKSGFTQNLSNEEIELIGALTTEVEQQKNDLIGVSKQRSELTNRRKLLEIELSEDLRRRREEVQTKLDSIGSSDAPDASDQFAELSTKRTELKNLEKVIKTLQVAIDDTEAEMEELHQKIVEDSAALDDKISFQAENSRTILKAQRQAERYLNKRNVLTVRKEECTKSIRDLGVLPEEAFTKYVNVNSTKILKLLHDTNNHLKRYAHVNKKAFEQYNDFTKQRDSLLKRREELEQSEESIQELITTLDQRKDEAIERTFKQVSLYFSQVFKKLVPAGKGRLVMQKRVDDESMDIDGANRRSNIASYSGVGIQVSFNSEKDERLMITQLSGGQRSIVSLALIFAIQRTEPSPFYLFDEIDANLDAQYRTAVAAMIHELSATSQYICTTFKSEMLAQADKFYGVMYDNNKVSSIRTIEKEDAEAFIEGNA